jgi:hypothetical protein
MRSHQLSEVVADLDEHNATQVEAEKSGSALAEKVAKSTSVA